jgi:hypothetical protein
VAEEITDGHGALHRRRLERGVIAAHEDAQVLPRRNEAVHGIIELEPPFLVEHHQPHAGDGLGHGVDAPHGIGGHRPAPLDLEMPLRLQVGHLPSPGHEGQGAGNLPRVDVALHVVADPGQARRRETDVFRLHGHTASL